MAITTISQDILKRFGLKAQQGLACYPMVFDSNQEFARKDPNTGKIMYQKINVDYQKTFDYFKRNKLKRMTFDAADSVITQTAPNVGFNLAQLTFFNPNVIPTLMSEDVTSQLLKTETVGSFVTQKQTFQFKEFYGSVQTYNDYNTAPTAGVNYDSVSLDQYRFESSIIYGDTEVETAAMGGLNLIADLQESLADTFAKSHERINLYGVKGMATYGFLNYPHYPSSLNAKSVQLSSGTSSAKWADKFGDAQSGANYIANDVLNLFGSIRTTTKNLVSPSNSFILAVSPEDANYLEARNSYGIGCLEIIRKTLPNLEVVVLPQLENSGSGRKVYLYPTSIKSQEVGTFAVTEKMSLGKMIEQPKSRLQTARAGTWGCIIRHPAVFGTLVVSQKFGASEQWQNKRHQR